MLLPLAQNFEGPYLKDDMGLYDINIGEWKIIDAGPVKCVIRAKGSNILNYKKVDFEITLTSYAAKSCIDVSNIFWELFFTVNVTQPVSTHSPCPV